MSAFKGLLVASALFVLSAAAAFGAETDRALPMPAVDTQAAQLQPMETAVLAGGCFWGMQGVFQHVKGVKQVWAGYSGGDAASAHYEMVGTGTTGHAESVKIVFDPREVSYGQILRVYFSVMDPTTLDYQGPDEGTQYRSEIFATSPGQQHIAQSYIAQLARSFSAPIVTKVAPFRSFYVAEGYHQDYLINHPYDPYIVFNDLPKVAKLKQLYPQLYADKPVTVAQNR
ncbi:MAG: peptide-methionine (S)-S-oxide reductase MsrA [Rhizomicrobium sp.]